MLTDDELPARHLSVSLEPTGWKEAAIAWEVCASIHRSFAKGKDALFKTRQAGFVRHADDARKMLAAAPATPQAKKHPDEAAVDRFAAAMKSKLAEKRRQGKSGWDDPRCPTEHLAALLREHVVKGDPLDVGNFAMMLWCRGGSTNETQAEPKRPIIEVITEFDAIGNWCRVALTVDGHRFFMEYCSEHQDDAEDFAEVLRKALGITGDSDAE